MLKENDILYTGAIVSKDFANWYNARSKEIESKEKIGMNCESLKNGKHRAFTVYAMTFKTNK